MKFVPSITAGLAMSLLPTAGGLATPASKASAPHTVTAKTVALPGASGHVGFDAMGFVPGLDRIVVPGGGTGTLYLIDPNDDAVTALDGVAAAGSTPGRRDAGTTSAAYANGYFIASDHPAQSLSVVDAKTGKVVMHVPLASGSDYVRYFAPIHQVWVTEPHAEQIEVFDADFTANPPKLTRIAAIAVPGGPEDLAFDAARGLAYTNLWKNYTLAIDATTRKIVAHWKDGCEGPRGLALAPRQNLLFVGCKEGKAMALDLAKNGAIAASAVTGDGVDIIAWNPTLRHLYVPGARSATLTILALEPGPRLRAIATVPTAEGAHCVATDGRRKAYVCDPEHGDILAVTDTLQ